MPPISLPEKRFKENTGERYLKNGKLRCHAQARAKIKQWRESYDDYTMPTEDLWPECQCGLAAEENQFVCRFHGGRTPRTVNPPRTILDVMPLDMAQKFRNVMDSPEYISRKDELNLLQVRQMMLLQDLEGEDGDKEAWASVHEALVKIKQGDNLNAIDYLERALQSAKNKRETWQEMYKIHKLMGDLTTTQVKTAKDLQSMATVEQVQGLISTVVSMITSNAQKHIDDPMVRNKFLNFIMGEMREVTGMTPRQVVDGELTNS